MASEWRFLARRVLTNVSLDTDLQLELTELTWTLSGPGSLKGSVAYDVGNAAQPDGRPLFEEWSTLLYAESGGVLRWGGIVTGARHVDGRWEIEASGLSTYPNGIPFEGDIVAVGLDPVTIVRSIWGHVQSYPDGNLGVVVTGSTGQKLGTAPEPYRLSWWDAPDCGREIDDLAKETPFDYVERVAWVGDGETIAHTIEVAHPRAGSKRDDLVFIVGDNVLSAITPEVDGDDFANEVFGLGAGEGKAMLRRGIARRDGRLRRVATYSAKDVTTIPRLDSLIADELRRRAAAPEVSSILVTDHPNAPLGSWSLGDDVLIEGYVPRLGEVAIWHRIVGWSLVSESAASLQLIRSQP